MSQKLLPLFEKEKRVDGFFFDPSTDVIYFFKSIDGKKVKFTTKVKRPHVTKAKWFANQKLKWMFGDKHDKTQPLIVDEIEAWMRVKGSEGLDDKTLAKVRQARLRIEPFWGQMFPREVTADNVAAWLAWMDAEFPGQLKFNAVKYFKNFCRYINSKQHEGRSLLPAIPRVVDPQHKMNLKARRKKTARIFTSAEFRKVRDVATPDEALVADIMGTMATRIEETLSMRFDEEVVGVPGGFKYCWSIGQNKADLDGEHAFPDGLTRVLSERLADSGGGLLFPQANDHTKHLWPAQIDWSGWRKRAGLGWHWTSKTFRHTCLSNLFNNPRYAQAVICRQYRVSLKVAIDTYVKPTADAIALLKNAGAEWT